MSALRVRNEHPPSAKCIWRVNLGRVSATLPGNVCTKIVLYAESLYRVMVSLTGVLQCDTHTRFYVC